MKLQISYYKDTDTLSFWNGHPAWSADDVAQNLLIDLDTSGSPVGLTLEHAVEISLPILLGESAKQERRVEPSSKSLAVRAEVPDRREDIRLGINYHAESDVLWLGNGGPTPMGVDISEHVSVFFDGGRPNAVTIEHAAEMLLPILQTAIQAKKDSNESSVKAAKSST